MVPPRMRLFLGATRTTPSELLLPEKLSISSLIARMKIATPLTLCSPKLKFTRVCRQTIKLPLSLHYRRL